MEEGSLRFGTSTTPSLTSSLFTPLSLERPPPEIEVERLKQALQSNVDYQAAIYERLSLVNKLAAATAEKKRTLQKYFSALPRRAGITLHQLRTAPFFYNSTGAPSDNFDTVIKKRQRGDKPPIEEYQPFAQDERRRLEAGIQAQGQDRLVRLATQAHEARVAAGEHQGASLAKFTLEMERIRELTLVEHILEDSSHINWEIVGQQVRTRSASACMIEWQGRLDPRINQGKWTKVEDKRLIALVQEHGDRAWSIVSRVMKNRTPVQCLQRYQRSHNSTLLLYKWTPEEDQKLAEAVLRYGDHNWQQVASCLAQRTDQQCLHRYSKSISTEIKSGKWSEHEDARLYVAVEAYGTKNWISIQQHVPRRTDVKCRERYMNILNPQLCMQAWTPLEDAKLLAYVRAKGIRHIRWTEAAKLLTPRTDNQVWRRWKRIGNHEQVAQYLNLQKCKDKMMVRNFVGRRAERPELDVVEVVGPAAYVDGEPRISGKKRAAPRRMGEYPTDPAQGDFNYIECVAALVSQMSPDELRMLHALMNSKHLLAQATGANGVGGQATDSSGPPPGATG